VRSVAICRLASIDANPNISLLSDKNVFNEYVMVFEQQKGLAISLLQTLDIVKAATLNDGLLAASRKIVEVIGEPSKLVIHVVGAARLIMEELPQSRTSMLKFSS
jgi:hypothetical protein